MARQILLKKYEKEIKEKEEKKEILKEKKNSNLGLEKLGPLVTANYF